MVKSIPNKNQDHDDLHEELKILLETDSPYVCKCYEIFFDAYYLHIVMENCQSGDLGAILKKEGKFSEDKCALVIKQCLKGLNHLHDLNVVHRDMKPENILCRDDICSEVLLADFGLSKVCENGEDKKGLDVLAGSPIYMAPEVLTLNYGKPCDLWSLGCIMFELLTGRECFLNTKKIADCDW